MVPYSVGFAAIGRAVAGGAGDDEGRRIAVTERVYQVIRQSVNHPGSENALAPTGPRGRRAGSPCSTPPPARSPSTPRNRSRTASGEPSPRRSRPGGARCPACCTSSADDDRALAVEVPDEEPTVLVAYGFRASPPDVVQLQHLASAMAVLLAQQNVRREHDRRTGAELLASLCDGRLTGADVGSRRSPTGACGPRARVLIAISRGSQSAERHLHVSLGRRHVPHLLLRRGPVLYALVAADDGPLAALRTPRRLRGGDRHQRPTRAIRGAGPPPSARRRGRCGPPRARRPHRALRGRHDAVGAARHRGSAGGGGPRARQARRLRRHALQRHGPRPWTPTCDATGRGSGRRRRWGSTARPWCTGFSASRRSAAVGSPTPAAIAEFWLALRARDLLSPPVVAADEFHRHARSTPT